MKHIDWQFELEVLKDCWADPVFRWVAMIAGSLLVVLIATGHFVLWVFLVGFVVTLAIARLGR